MRSRPVLPVILGIVVIAIQAALNIALAIGAFSVLSSAAPGTEGLAKSQLLAGTLLVIGIVNAVALFFVARGWGVARFVILVVGAIIVVLDVAASQLTLGDFLWAIAMVLLFLPVSNRWFGEQAAARKPRL